MRDARIPELPAFAAALADRYRVERELGAGGMATVYLAHDLKHDRPVAIKVLHEDLGATLGPERFLAEIKTTARLQHPHILPLLDSGSAGGLLFYVMPFVDGETLRDRLTRDQQLPLDDALRIAREVADALAFAHAHGIVHRDIKPENILLQGGHAVVADFGIALAVQSAGGSRLTQTGLSLGTPQYMSPEQAMGDRHVGAAADQYALGAVTYEMLTGDPPFSGSSVQAVVAKVLSERPTPISTIRETVPAHIEAAVLRALAKLPADRFADAKLFAEALSSAPVAGSSAFAARAHSVNGERARARGTATRWRTVSLAMAGIALFALAFAWRAAGRAGVASQLRSYDVALPDSAPIAFAKGSPWGEGWTSLAISPRGEFLVYIADRGADTELWYRSLLDTIARPIPGTAGAYQLAMSPDGSSVAFISGAKLRLASLGGEPVRELGTVRRPTGLTFRSRDRILVADTDDGLVEFDRLGGQPRTVADLPCGIPFADSEEVVVCAEGLLGISSGQMRPLTIGGEPGSLTDARSFVTLDDRHVLFSAPDGSVIAARLDREAGTVNRRTVVLAGVRTESVYGARQTAIARDGTLAFVPGAHNGEGQLVRSDGTRPAVALDIPRLMAKQFDVSPDGRRLAVTVTVAEGAEAWIYDLGTGQGFLWLASRALEDPRWSPDGQQVAIYMARGADPPVTVVGRPSASGTVDSLRGVSVYPSQWLSPNRLLGSGGGIFSASVMVWIDFADRTRIRADTVTGPRGMQRGVVSRDGRLLAYMLADEIAVEPVGGGSRSVVGRGIDPVWLDARTLVYRDGTTWFRVRLGDDASPAERPRRWFSDPRFVDTNLRSHALTREGEVIYLQSRARSTASYVRIVPRWTDQVRAAVAREGR